MLTYMRDTNICIHVMKACPPALQPAPMKCCVPVVIVRIA
jgi:hypothetical protein